MSAQHDDVLHDERPLRAHVDGRPPTRIATKVRPVARQERPCLDDRVEIVWGGAFRFGQRGLVVGISNPRSGRLYMVRFDSDGVNEVVYPIEMKRIDPEMEAMGL